MENSILLELAKHLPQGASPERLERVARARDDFFFFCKTYLPHIFPSDFCSFHEEVIACLNSKNRQKIVLAAPRGHGKTSLVFVGYSLWALLTGREKFIVVIASSAVMASDQLANIKQELEVNELLLEDFGEQKTDIWRQDSLVLKSGATIIAKGSAASMRGLLRRGNRPSLVIMDDLEKDVVANSAVMRQKLDRWIRRVVFPLGRDTKIFYIGTILHYDSVLKRFLDEFANDSGWFVRKFQALLPDGNPLWSAYWTKEKLEEKRREIGSAAFASEYMNEPMASEDRVFKEEWLEFYERHQLPAGLDVVMAVDPSTGKKTGDYQGLVVLGKDKSTGVVYVLAASGERLSVSGLGFKIIELYLQFRPRVILFEDLVFQAVYKSSVAQLASKQGLSLPLRGVKPAASKEIRIGAISPLVENGILRFHKSQTLLIRQFLEFPFGGHDDLPDALAYAVSAFESRFVGGTPIAQTFKMSFADRLERTVRHFF